MSLISKRARALAAMVPLLVVCLALPPLSASGAGVSAANAPVVARGRAGDSGRQWSTLLAQASDLGPSRAAHADVVALLRSAQRPDLLLRWAAVTGLRATWYRGESWALLSGTPLQLGRGLRVAIDDYRFGSGHVFYAARRAAVVPAIVRSEVRALGTISSYSELSPDDAPAGGILPTGILKAYDATPLRAFTGQGQTVVVFEVDDYNQPALDAFDRDVGLASFTPVVLGGRPKHDEGESDLDMETIHEIAPAARIVDVNISNDDIGQQDAAFAKVEKLYPRSIWSLSLGICESFLGANPSVDLTAQNNALAAAEALGTTVFAASGDTGGLECTPNYRFGAIPQNSFFGVQEPASLPAVTGVGGTNLNVGRNGSYQGETAWTESVLSEGSGGGVSNYFVQPSWQHAPGTGKDNQNAHGVSFRQVPDVSADADPSSGNFIVDKSGPSVGGGTSLSSPIWAGFMVLIDQYLESAGGRAVGFLNPDLYALADTTPAYPPFHDVTVGGNAAYLATPGYDMVTGLGTPDVWDLARDLLALEKASGQ